MMKRLAERTTALLLAVLLCFGTVVTSRADVSAEKEPVKMKAEAIDLYTGERGFLNMLEYDGRYYVSYSDACGLIFPQPFEPNYFITCILLDCLGKFPDLPQIISEGETYYLLEPMMDCLGTYLLSTGDGKLYYHSAYAWRSRFMDLAAEYMDNAGYRPDILSDMGILGDITYGLASVVDVMTNLKVDALWGGAYQDDVTDLMLRLMQPLETEQTLFEILKKGSKHTKNAFKVLEKIPESAGEVIDEVGKSLNDLFPDSPFGYRLLLFKDNVKDLDRAYQAVSSDLLDYMIFGGPESSEYEAWKDYLELNEGSLETDIASGIGLFKIGDLIDLGVYCQDIKQADGYYADSLEAVFDGPNKKNAEKVSGQIREVLISDSAYELIADYHSFRDQNTAELLFQPIAFIFERAAENGVESVLNAVIPGEDNLISKGALWLIDRLSGYQDKNAAVLTTRRCCELQDIFYRTYDAYAQGEYETFDLEELRSSVLMYLKCAWIAYDAFTFDDGKESVWDSIFNNQGVKDAMEGAKEMVEDAMFNIRALGDDERLFRLIPNDMEFSAGTFRNVYAENAYQAYYDVLTTGRWIDERITAAADGWGAREYSDWDRETLRESVLDYYLYDVDGDGTEELLISAGASMAEWRTDLYTFRDHAAVYAGMAGTGLEGVLGRTDGTGIRLGGYHGGEEWEDRTELLPDGTLYSEYLYNGETEITTGQTEPLFEEDHWESDTWYQLTAHRDPEELRELAAEAEAGSKTGEEEGMAAGENEEASEPDDYVLPLCYDVESAIIDDMYETTDKMYSWYELLAEDIVTYEDYVNNRDRVFQFYQDVRKESGDLCIRIREYIAGYVQTLINDGSIYDTENMEELYDSIYDKVDDLFSDRLDFLDEANEYFEDILYDEYNRLDADEDLEAEVLTDEIDMLSENIVDHIWDVAEGLDDSCELLWDMLSGDWKDEYDWMDAYDWLDGYEPDKQDILDSFVAAYRVLRGDAGVFTVLEDAEDQIAEIDVQAEKLITLTDTHETYCGSTGVFEQFSYETLNTWQTIAKNLLLRDFVLKYAEESENVKFDAYLYACMIMPEICSVIYEDLKAAVEYVWCSSDTDILRIIEAESFDYDDPELESGYEYIWELLDDCVYDLRDIWKADGVDSLGRICLSALNAVKEDPELIDMIKEGFVEIETKTDELVDVYVPFNGSVTADVDFDGLTDTILVEKEEGAGPRAFVIFGCGDTVGFGTDSCFDFTYDPSDGYDPYQNYDAESRQMRFISFRSNGYILFTTVYEDRMAAGAYWGISPRVFSLITDGDYRNVVEMSWDNSAIAPWSEIYDSDTGRHVHVVMCGTDFYKDYYYDLTDAFYAESFGESGMNPGPVGVGMYKEVGYEPDGNGGYFLTLTADTYSQLGFSVSPGKIWIVFEPWSQDYLADINGMFILETDYLN